MKNIRLKIPGESFWAMQYDDLPPNQAEINNDLLSDQYHFGDRVEFDAERNVTRLVKTREQVAAEQAAGGAARPPRRPLRDPEATPELSVVSPIRGGAPLLTDIAGQLRALADQIERGEVTPEAAYTVLVMPDQFEPYFYGWGAVADRHGVAGVFTHVSILALSDRNEGWV